MPGRSEQERGREEEEEEKDSRKRQVRYEIVHREKGKRAQVDVKPTAQKRVGQSVKQCWDCSQIEIEEEDEEEDWQEEDQMEVQLAEDEKLEEVLERRRMGWKLFASGSLAKGT